MDRRTFMHWIGAGLLASSLPAAIVASSASKAQTPIDKPLVGAPEGGTVSEELTAFGYASLTQNGRKAIGGRPLLLVLGEYSNFPPFSDIHPLEYYESLAFGNPSPPFSTRNPVNPASLRQYFSENSNGRFWFERAGIIGPIPLGEYIPANDPGPEKRLAQILQQIASASSDLFWYLDITQDQHVSTEEVCIVTFENVTGLMPANRQNEPFMARNNLGTWNGTVSLRIAGAGAHTPFYQIAHELSHSLGTFDLYNVGQGNLHLTLMSRYSFDSDDQFTVHLDIWHKLLLGWAEPRPFRIQPAGEAIVHEGADGAIILWDEQRLASGEYFMVERRRPRSDGSPGKRAKNYDLNFPDDGLLIWRVQKGTEPVAGHLGAPDLTFGGNGIWKAGQKTPPLKWSDDALTNVAITIGSAESDGSMRISWSEVT